MKRRFALIVACLAAAAAVSTGVSLYAYFAVHTESGILVSVNCASTSGASLTATLNENGTVVTHKVTDSICSVAQPLVGHTVSAQVNMWGWITSIKGSPTTSSTVTDVTTGNPPSGTELAGASFRDTATVSGVVDFPPNGTVTYYFFLDGTCSGTAAWSYPITLSIGIVPPSNST